MFNHVRVPGIAEAATAQTNSHEKITDHT